MAEHAYDAKHTLREVRLLRFLGKHRNIITLKDLMVRCCAVRNKIKVQAREKGMRRLSHIPPLPTGPRQGGRALHYDGAYGH